LAAPYRDELESLRAENARLRAALTARRRAHAGMTVFLVLAELGALVLLLPWLNAPSDARFWGATAILVVLGIAATLSTFGYRRS